MSGGAYSSSASTFIVAASLLWTLTQYSCVGLDLESAKEQPCFEITKTVNVDDNWLLTASKTWYYVLTSRLELYYFSLEVAEKTAEELQEDELYYDGCIRFQDQDIVGFGDRRSTYNVVPLIPSNQTGQVKSCNFTLESGRSGKTYLTLTDNSTFLFSASCMDDNQMTWSVVSPYKTLSNETVKQIHEHAESLGFKQNFFTGMRYDYCKDSSEE